MVLASVVFDRSWGRSQTEADWVSKDVIPMTCITLVGRAARLEEFIHYNFLEIYHLRLPI